MAIKQMLEEFLKPRLDANGHELPDPTPLSLPSGFKAPETLAETVKRLVRAASREAEQAGDETFEEAEDFDVGDDFDPSTPYETFFDPVLNKEISPAEFMAAREHYREQYMAHFAKQAHQTDLDELVKEKTKEKTGGGQRPPKAPAKPAPGEPGDA